MLFKFGPPVLFLGLIAATSACAFNCKAAKSASEKAICASPDAIAADAEMAAAFDALTHILDAKQKAEAGKAQVRWIADRDEGCIETKGDALSSCLAEASRTRTRFLTASPDAGAGNIGRLVPFFRAEKGRKGRTDINVAALKFVEPRNEGERAFNAATDKLLSDIPQPQAEDAARDDYSFSLETTPHYLSDILLSVQTTTARYAGGAHGGTLTINLNFDMRTGRELKFADLMTPAAKTKIDEACLKQVVAQKREREGKDLDLSTEALKDLRQQVVDADAGLEIWSFGKEGASLTYNQYVVGSYAEGVFACEIRYTTLRPLAKPGFPLP